MVLFFKQQKLKKIRQRWDAPPKVIADEYRDLFDYSDRSCQFALDDMTWKDLELHSILNSMSVCSTHIGLQVLYDKLRRFRNTWDKENFFLKQAMYLRKRINKREALQLHLENFHGFPVRGVLRYLLTQSGGFKKPNKIVFLWSLVCIFFLHAAVIWRGRIYLCSHF